MRLTTISRISIRALLWCALPGICGAVYAQEDTRQMHLTLPEAIDLALKQNRSLKLVQLAVTESEYKKEIARSAYFPKIKNESAVLHITALAGVEIPAGAFGNHSSTGLIPAQSLFIGQGADTSYTSGTGLLQPITQIFKIRESNRAASADVNTAKIQATQAENEIALKVRQLYYSILITQMKQQAAAEQLRANKIKDHEATQSVENGRALEVAALESRAAILDATQTALTERLQTHNLSLTLADLLGLPLSTQFELDSDTSALPLAIPTRSECIQIAEEHSTEVQAAKQGVNKARAGLGAAKDAYIPDVTGLARYSYQSGIPFLVHNFGSFGVTFSYDLFDGGRRYSELKDARTVLAQASLNLTRVEEEVSVQVQAAYDKVEQLQGMVGVAQESMKVREELARLSSRQFEQDAALASTQADAQAKLAGAKASYLEAALGLSIAQADLKRTIGQMPR